MADEKILVEALRNRDEAAFRGVVQQYHPSLVRVARTFVPTTAIAEEVAQDTWLAVIKGLPGFEGRSSFKTWLFRILINQARTRGERESRTVPVSTLIDDDEPSVAASRFHGSNHQSPGHWRSDLSDWGELPESVLLSSETRSIIVAAIATLPAAQREVITLRDIEGLDPMEVCSLLGLTEGNQRVRLHRARSKVRSILETHLDEALS